MGGWGWEGERVGGGGRFCARDIPLPRLIFHFSPDISREGGGCRWKVGVSYDFTIRLHSHFADTFSYIFMHFPLEAGAVYEIRNKTDKTANGFGRNAMYNVYMYVCIGSICIRRDICGGYLHRVMAKSLRWYTDFF